MTLEPTHPRPGRRTALIAGYLMWVSLFFAIEGLGRMKCHVPSQTWIEAGADARERHLRRFRYDQSVDCLHEMAWYSYSTTALIIIALVAPFVIVGVFAKRILRFAHRLPFDLPRAAAVIYCYAFLIALFLSIGPYGAAQDFYDRYGVGKRQPLLTTPPE